MCVRHACAHTCARAYACACERTQLLVSHYHVNRNSHESPGTHYISAFLLHTHTHTSTLHMHIINTTCYEYQSYPNTSADLCRASAATRVENSSSISARRAPLDTPPPLPPPPPPPPPPSWTHRGEAAAAAPADACSGHCLVINPGMICH